MSGATDGWAAELRSADRTRGDGAAGSDTERGGAGASDVGGGGEPIGDDPGDETAIAGRSVGEWFRSLVADGSLDLPDPGAGQTPDRLRALFDWGRVDVSLARLIEAHTDAVAILHEAGRAHLAGVAYGVWAAEDPSTSLALRDEGGQLTLSGTKAFCTAAGIVDRALVTVRTTDGVLLIDCDVHPGPRVAVDTTGWITSAFADTSTGVVTFDDVPVHPSDVVGGPGWYLDRPGFWHGACAPAACWAGGAAGLADWMVTAAAATSANPHRDAHLGAVRALAWQLVALLDTAGAEIDRAPEDQPAAHRRALAVRHLVERSCVELVDRVGRALGPRPYAFDAAVSRRLAEVTLYVRQCHAERDLEALGTALRTQDQPTT